MTLQPRCSKASFPARTKEELGALYDLQLAAANAPGEQCKPCLASLAAGGNAHGPRGTPDLYMVAEGISVDPIPSHIPTPDLHDNPPAVPHHSP